MKTFISLRKQVRHIGIYLDFGWFSGNDFTLAHIRIFDFFAGSSAEIFSITIAKFCIGFGIDW